MRKITMQRESDQSVSPSGLSTFLSNSAATLGDKVAVVHGERKTTYAELWQASYRMANRLKALKLDPCSRIAILYENSVEYIIAYFAISLADHVIVPLDTSLAPESLKSILNDCAAEALIIQKRLCTRLSEIIEGNGTLKLIISDDSVDPSVTAIPCETLASILTTDNQVPKPFVSKTALAEDNRMAAIFYTSGSTGQSKGVMLSHRNLVSNSLATVEYLNLSRDDSVLIVLPFHYIYGNSLLLTHLAVGGTLVIDNRLMYPEVILDVMEQEKVSGFSGVPSHYMILLSHSTFSRRAFSNLRYFTQAGGSMAPEVIRQLMNAFPGKQVFIMYGQTEAAPRITWLPPDKLSEKIGSIGIAIPGLDVQLLDESGQESKVGETGELTVRGDNVMMGYFNQPEETCRVIRNGRLYTGDLARRDDDGYLFIVGRKKDIIKAGGYRVSPKEVEDSILEQEKVSEVAVFGVPDDILGEAVKAVVVLRPGCQLSTRELQAACRTKLAVHKLPRFVLFTDRLPKLKSGKVDKEALKKEDDLSNRGSQT